MSSNLSGKTTNASARSVTVGVRASEKQHGKSLKARRESRREDQRYRYDDPAGIEVCIVHPGGSQACFRVVPRDLSAGGFRFEHNNFLYPGSECRCKLRSTSKAIVVVASKLVRCTHVSGRTHELGVQFDTSLDVAQFVDVENDLIEADAAGNSRRRD